MQNLSRGDHTMTLVLRRLSKFGEVMMLWSKKNIQDVFSKTYSKVCYKLQYHPSVKSYVMTIHTKRRIK